MCATMLAGCSQAAPPAAPAAAAPTGPLSATWAAKINAVDTGYPRICVRSKDARCLTAIRKIMAQADGLHDAITTGHLEAQYPSTLSYLAEMTRDWRDVQANCMRGDVVDTSDGTCLVDVDGIAAHGVDISGMQPDSVGVLKEDEAAAK